MVWTSPIATVVGFAAGAVLFFGIGVFVARLAANSRKFPHRSAAADAGDESPGAGHLPSADSRANAHAEGHEPLIEQYRSLVAYTVRQKHRVRSAFLALKGRIAELKRRVESAESSNDALVKKIGRLSGELEHSSLNRQDLLREKENDSQALEALKRKLEDATERLEALHDVEATHQELLQRVEKREVLYQDAEALRDENSWLKSQLAEAADLKDRIDALRKENARLNAMGIVADKPVSHPVSSPLEGLGGSFQNIVNRLSAMEGSRGAVLADDLGLPIAGTGDHMEGMAGMAAVFSDVCLKLDALLPFGDVDVMRISNRQGLTVTMQPFEIASADVIVTTLSAGAGPDRDAVDRLIAQATADR